MGVILSRGQHTEDMVQGRVHPTKVGTGADSGGDRMWSAVCVKWTTSQGSKAWERMEARGDEVGEERRVEVRRKEGDL